MLLMRLGCVLREITGERIVQSAQYREVIVLVLSPVLFKVLLDIRVLECITKSQSLLQTAGEEKKKHFLTDCQLFFFLYYYFFILIFFFTIVCSKTVVEWRAGTGIWAGKAPGSTCSILFCGVCGYSSVYATTMRNHVRLHSGERPFACHCCGRLFVQKYNMIMHMRTAHNVI